MAGLELKLFILHSVNRLTQLASLKVLGSIDRYGQFLYVHVRHWQLVSIVIIYANKYASMTNMTQLTDKIDQ